MSKTTFTLKRKLFNVAGSTFGRIMGFNNWSNVGHMMTGNLNTATNLATKQTVKINPATNKAVNGNMAWNITKGIAKPLAMAGVATAGLGLAAKKGIEKAGEQSDGSKLFSQTKKDSNMATTYRLKRKTFSEGDEKKSNFGKIALGTAATAGLAFAGARRGMLGTNAMKSTNAMWAKAGNAIGSRSMVQSGAKKYGAAVVKESGAKLEGKALDQAINKERKAFLKNNNMLQTSFGTKKAAASTKSPQPKQKVNPESIMDVGYEG
jgi:hypothetical protein